MGKKLRKYLLVLSLVLAGGFFPLSRAGAETFDFYGCGARGMAMANSLLTLADSACAFYYNPALSPKIDHSFTLGYNGVFDLLYIDTHNPETKPSGDILNTHGIMVGMASTFGIPNFKAGAVIYSPVNRLQLQHSWYSDEREYLLANRLYFTLLGDVTQVQTIIIGGGYQILPALALGIAFDVSINTSTINECYFPEVTDMSDLYLTMDTYQYNEVSPIAGLYVRVSPMIQLGFAYRQGSDFAIRGEARYRGKFGGVDLIDMFPDDDRPEDVNYMMADIKAYTFYTPDRFSGSCGLNLLADIDLELGLDWARWSKYKNTLEEAINQTEDPPMRDITVLRAGVEKADSMDRQFRAGLMYSPSPVPDQTRRQNLVDNDRLIFSSGLGYPLEFAGREIRADFACQWQHLLRREVTKVEPYYDAEANLEGIQNPGYPGYTSGGNLIALQLTLNYTF